MSSVKFPVAFGVSGQLFQATTATVEDGPFKCVHHGCRMALKKGKIMQPHFSHVNTTDSIDHGCGESWQHSLAKRIVHDNYRALQMHEVCTHCMKPAPKIFNFNQIQSGQLEFRTGERVIDVGLFSDVNKQTLVYGIEICFTHAVSFEKYEQLQKTCVLLEVNAEDVIERYEKRNVNDGTFVVVCRRQDEYVCLSCTRKDEDREVARLRRPCAKCRCWDESSAMVVLPYKITTSNYPNDWLCTLCVRQCLQCKRVCPKKKDENNRCPPCHHEYRQWVHQIEILDQCFNETTYYKVEKLLLFRPVRAHDSEIIKLQTIKRKIRLIRVYADRWLSSIGWSLEKLHKRELEQKKKTEEEKRKKRKLEAKLLEEESKKRKLKEEVQKEKARLLALEKMEKDRLLILDEVVSNFNLEVHARLLVFEKDPLNTVATLDPYKLRWVEEELLRGAGAVGATGAWSCRGMESIKMCRPWLNRIDLRALTLYEAAPLQK